MHKAIEDVLRQSRDPISLSTIRSRYSLILAFSASQRWPIWVAKSARGEEGVRELEKEYTALLLLQPWQRELQIPTPLNWYRDEEESCLVLSGVTGIRHYITLDPEEPHPRDESRLRSGVTWLRRFRELVPVMALEERGQRLFSADPALLPQAEGLFEFISRVPEIASVVASHGDFWYGNLLFDDLRLSGVIDWPELGLRSPLHDVMSLLVHCCYIRRGVFNINLDADAFFTLFFSETPTALYARDIVAELRPSSAELRHGFYCFIWESLRIAGPVWRNVWFTIARRLQQLNFPEPWSLGSYGNLS